MSTHVSNPASAPGAHLSVLSPGGWLSELLRRQRTLTLLGLALWLAMVPATIALGLDERTLRGVNVWAKPLKFLAATGLFALYTAWFIGMLDEAHRHTRATRIVVSTVLVTSLFEVGYIILQASRGEASHFNVSDPFHGVMYTLMGAGALALTATQVLLAVQLHRHARPDLPATMRRAVVTGMVLTFVLGAGAGALLGGIQPPDGKGLPIVGWHLAGGDLRPAHFIGIHAQQFVPFVALVLKNLPPRKTTLSLFAFCGLLIVIWAFALALGLKHTSLT